MKTESDDPNVIAEETRAANGQAVNIAEWRKYSGAIVASIDKDGAAHLPNVAKINNEFAVGTGSAYTTIQAGVDAAEAVGGGVVILLNQTHTISVPVVISKKTITIRGDGADTLVHYTGITGAAFDCDGINTDPTSLYVGPRFECFKLTGPGYTAGTTIGISFCHYWVSGPHVCDARNKISGLSVTGFYYGIKVHETYEGIVENCYLGENNYGFYGQAANEWVLTANEIQHNHIAGVYLGKATLNGQAGFLVQGGAIEGNFGTGLILESQVITATFVSVDFESNGLGDVSQYDVSMVTTDALMPNNICFLGCNFYSDTTVSVNIAAGWYVNFYGCMLTGGAGCTYSIDGAGALALVIFGCRIIKPCVNLPLGTLVFDGTFSEDLCIANNVPVVFRAAPPGSGLAHHTLKVDASDDMLFWNSLGNLKIWQYDIAKSIIFEMRFNEPKLTISYTGVHVYPLLDVFDNGITLPHAYAESQPALMTGAGQINVWKKTSTAKTYLMTQMGGTNYKVELTTSTPPYINSGNSVGTGAQQTIAHGLSGAPNRVKLWNIDMGCVAYQSAAADATNIYITGLVGMNYGWEAKIV